MTVQDPPATPLAIALFGPFSVLVNGAPLARLRWRKQEAILALLTLRHGRLVDRAWLAGLLWPDVAEGQGLATLRRYLTGLRRALGPEAPRLRSPTSATLLFDLAGAAVDVTSFEAALSRGDPEALEEAVSLYRGPLLEGWTDEWVFEERQACEQAYLHALEKLAIHASEREDLGTAERHLRRAAAVDPLRENAQRALMQTLAAGGSYAAAAQVYQELRRRLHQELNAEPDPQTQALFQRLRAQARAKAGGRGQAAGVSKVNGSDRGTAGRDFTGTDPRSLTPDLAGTVTFLLTDIEGSTKLWLQNPDAMRRALARHDDLAAALFAQHDGLLVKQRGEGDSLFAVFARATDAVAAALAFQRALATDDPHLPLRVRVALHTGEAERREGDYFGLAVNHCARLRAVSHGGQTLLSQTTAALARDALPEGVSLRELGAHRLKDLQRPEPIFQLVHPELASAFPPLRSLEAFAHNLPVQLTRFIGREREMAEVKGLLGKASPAARVPGCQPSAVSEDKPALTDSRQPGTHGVGGADSPRLLTLTGAGGCGKTRLALQVASELVEECRDGVWLVELASLSDPGLVPQTVASTLGVREAGGAEGRVPARSAGDWGPGPGGRPFTEAVADALRPRSLLLVLDNCEHLLSACAQLTDRLLRRCPHLRILATSREALGLLGEQTYRVPSLSLPDPGQLAFRQCLQQSEAVQLFVDRVLFNQPSFAVTEANAPAVAQICHRLDGIPLAIELAAARVKALPVEKLSERLADRFRLLTGGSRTALPRHQTLRALIDWSYDLLTEPERTLLQRLSVFAGGWTLEAAEAICGFAGVRGQGSGASPTGASRPELTPGPWPLTPDEVFDLLTSLVEKSLVVYEEQEGEARYRLLETIRQYAWERLVEAGETEAVRGRHLDFFLRLAEEADSNLGIPERAVWLDRLDGEHDNLRTALDWCQADAERAEAGLRLAGSLSAFWVLRGYCGEGQRWVREALSRSGEIGRSAVRARGLLGAGRLAQVQSEHAVARSLLEESAAIWREMGDKRGLAQSLALLGWVALHLGDESRSHSLFEETSVLAEEIGCQWSLLTSLNGLAWIAHQQGGWVKARSLRQRLLTLSQEGGDRWGTALALTGLGSTALEQGDWETARALYEECLPVRQELGQRVTIAGTLRTLGAIALAQGNWEVARLRCEESLPITRELGDRVGLTECLETLAGIAAGQGQSEQAARLFGAAEALWESLGESRPTGPLAAGGRGGAAASRAGFWFEVAHVLAIVGERGVAATRSVLGEEEFALAWEAGRALSLEQALADALEHNSTASG